MAENERLLKRHLKQHAPCLVEAIELARYIFANADDDDKYDLAFVVMDYVNAEEVSTTSIAQQCFYVARDHIDTEFASAALYWLQVQNELSGEDPRAVAGDSRAAAGSGSVGLIIHNYVTRGVIG